MKTKEPLVKINANNEIFRKSYDPKTTNRFICYIDDIPAYILKNIQRPSCILTRNIFGVKKWKWNPIVLTAYDPICPSGAKAFMSYVTNPRKFNLIIRVLSPVAETIEEWTIFDAMFTKIDFESLSWEEKGIPATITATVKYKFALLT